MEKSEKIAKNKSKKINLVCEARLKKYREITEKAMQLARNNIAKGKEKQADEIIEMASAYLLDAAYFEKQGHYVNAFACLNYAHGWLDAGARLGLFNVNDNKLFTIK